jgi:hypothetical protein
MPSEIYPDDWHFNLTADVEAYQKEGARSRNDEEAWPKTHYLWSRHPIIEWLQERMLANTGRHEALILGLNSDLSEGESIFLVSALIPNRKSHPVIWSWYAVHCQGDTVSHITPLQELLEKFDFGNTPRPNTNNPIDQATLDSLRSPVVEAVRKKVLEEKATLDAELKPRLDAQLSELSKLKGKQEKQLELNLIKGLESTKASKKRSEQKRIDDIFDAYQTWVKDTMRTEPAPYIQLIAVLARTTD